MHISGMDIARIGLHLHTIFDRWMNYVWCKGWQVSPDDDRILSCGAQKISNNTQVSQFYSWMLPGHFLVQWEFQLPAAGSSSFMDLASTIKARRALHEKMTWTPLSHMHNVTIYCTRVTVEKNKWQDFSSSLCTLFVIDQNRTWGRSTVLRDSTADSFLFLSPTHDVRSTLSR